MKKVLIVDDEENILELLSTEFIDTGKYEVSCARDGEEALRIARLNNPDIVILLAESSHKSLNSESLVNRLRFSLFSPSGPNLSRLRTWRFSSFVSRSIPSLVNPVPEMCNSLSFRNLLTIARALSVNSEPLSQLIQRYSRRLILAKCSIPVSVNPLGKRR